MTDLDLTALRAVAEAATPGPWEWEPEGFMGCGQVYTMGEHVEGGSIAGPTGDCYPRSGYSPKEDMQHIATFDPPTVLALIERAERAEAERDEACSELDRVRQSNGPVYHDEVCAYFVMQKDLRAERDALAAKLEAVKRLAEWKQGQSSSVLKSEIRDALAAVQSVQETDQ